MKHIKLPFGLLTASVLILQKTRYLVLNLNTNRTQFFKISDQVDCEITSTSLGFTTNKRTPFYNPPPFLIKNYLRAVDKKFKKQIKLSGMGYKIDLLLESNALQFKLGYSHLLFVFIPTLLITVKIKKNKILFESYNKMFLGNFVYKILKLKLPDSYKGKGFLTKYSTVQLKTIKKK